MSLCSLPDNPTYTELVSTVQALLRDLSGLQDIALRGQTAANLIGRLDELCRSNQRLVIAVADLQARLQKIENCSNGPIIVSVAAA